MRSVYRVYIFRIYLPSAAERCIMEFVSCCLYFLILGATSFLVGRLISSATFNSDYFPFRSFKWENDGAVYEKFKVRLWKDKLIDMSKILPFAMPEKKVEFGYSSKQIRLLINETCTAELVHVLLIVLGLHCLKLWHGIGGVIMYLLYSLLGNVPYIIIQRYNRPKLKKLLTIVQKREKMYESTPCTENEQF